MADLEAFRAQSPDELPPVPSPARTKKKRAHATEPFLRGPVPVAWLARAHAAGGSALAVGLALWFVRGVSGERAPVKVGSSVRRRFELSRDQTGYGLRALEAAGLVCYVKRGRGRCPVVEIADQPLREGCLP
jgi:DNA-binding transcriptional ArsR family regulator